MTSCFQEQAIANIARTITSLSEKQAIYFVAIDGRGGAGKSTLADQLARTIDNAQIIRMDDFLLPVLVKGKAKPARDSIGSYSDWQRLQAQAINPLKNKQVARYQKYDWASDSLAAWQEISPGGTIIIEGVYALRKELIAYYDYKIWMECSKSFALARGIARDGEASKSFWSDIWIPEEDKYIESEKPFLQANLVVSGS